MENPTFRPPEPHPDPPAEEESEEIARLRETAKIGPWIEIARANTERASPQKRRFRRKRS